MYSAISILNFNTLPFNIQFGVFCLIVFFGSGLFCFIAWLIDKYIDKKKSERINNDEQN